MTEETFEPKLVGFLCNWCSYTASDLAGTSRMEYAPNIRIIRVMCSGRVDPTFVLKAFALGADGVMIAGCHPGDFPCAAQPPRCGGARKVRPRAVQPLNKDDKPRRPSAAGFSGDTIRTYTGASLIMASAMACARGTSESISRYSSGV